MLIILLVLILSIITYLLFKNLFFFNQISSKKSVDNKNNLRVLLINSEKKYGGGEVYTLELYKNLIQQKINASLLVVNGSVLEKKLIETELPYYTYQQYSIFKTLIQPGLYTAILKICRQDKINIIHCNIHRETIAAKKVAHKLNLKVILTRHVPKIPKTKYLKNLDGLIAVNPQIKKNLQNKKYNIKQYTFIPPFFNKNKALNFKPTNNKTDFFSKNFNLKLKSFPLICTIANMPKDLTHKNHSVLFQATQYLIYKKNIPIEILLVGDGPNKPILKNEVKKLKLENYIHFLGFSNKVNEILFHSDIKVLPSKNEAFGIVLLEASLFKKPIICATNIGAANTIIFDNQTGLLFKNNNHKSLAEKIEYLLINKNLCKKLGENAYANVYSNFSVTSNIKKLRNFYQEIINGEKK